MNSMNEKVCVCIYFFISSLSVLQERELLIDISLIFLILDRSFLSIAVNSLTRRIFVIMIIIVLISSQQQSLLEEFQ